MNLIYAAAAFFVALALEFAEQRVEAIFSLGGRRRFLDGGRRSFGSNGWIRGAGCQDSGAEGRENAHARESIPAHGNVKLNFSCGAPGA